MNSIPDFQPWLEICRAHRASTLKKLMDSKLANGSGLILLILEDYGDMHPKDILRIAKVSSRRFWASLHALHEQGLVVKRKNARKGVFYSITDNGRRMINDKKQ